MTALLGQVCGGQIDRDPLGGQGKTQRLKSRAHPLAGFTHRLVGQADNGEGRQPRAHLHLDVDIDHIHALEGDRVDVCDHVPRVPDRFAPDYTEISNAQEQKTNK